MYFFFIQIYFLSMTRDWRSS